MITVTILQNQQQYIGLECSGHAMYAKSGKDIVCAAVSILIINTINGIEQFTEDGLRVDAHEPKEKRFFEKLFSKEEENFIKFSLTGEISKETKVLMDTLVLGLTEINKQYGDSYLTLFFREV